MGGGDPAGRWMGSAVTRMRRRPGAPAAVGGRARGLRGVAVGGGRECVRFGVPTRVSAREIRVPAVRGWACRGLRARVNEQEHERGTGGWRWRVYAGRSLVASEPAGDAPPLVRCGTQGWPWGSWQAGPLRAPSKAVPGGIASFRSCDGRVHGGGMRRRAGGVRGVIPRSYDGRPPWAPKTFMGCRTGDGMAAWW